MFDWLKRVFRDPSNEPPLEEGPTEKQISLAKQVLQASMRTAQLGEIGGFRPPADTTTPRSWWGGNILALPGEGVPKSSDSDRAMIPIVQVRPDELEILPDTLANVALFSVWWDPMHKDLGFLGDRERVCIVRSYASFDDLEPLSLIDNGISSEFLPPVFPISWSEPVLDKPCWEDIALEVPGEVARSTDDDWYEEAAILEMLDNSPLKIGGWPQWIQGSQWPDGATHVLTIDSTGKGHHMFADSGSIYIFLKDGEWMVRGDFY